MSNLGALIERLPERSGRLPGGAVSDNPLGWSVLDQIGVNPNAVVLASYILSAYHIFHACQDRWR